MSVKEQHQTYEQELLARQREAKSVEDLDQLRTWEREVDEGFELTVHRLGNSAVNKIEVQDESGMPVDVAVGHHAVSAAVAPEAQNSGIDPSVLAAYGEKGRRA